MFDCILAGVLGACVIADVVAGIMDFNHEQYGIGAFAFSTGAFTFACFLFRLCKIFGV